MFDGFDSVLDSSNLNRFTFKFELLLINSCANLCGFGYSTDNFSKHTMRNLRKFILKIYRV